MQHKVSEFIVIAPSGMGKAIEWAEKQLLSYLEGNFPFYHFRVEPFGPFADEWDFGVIPIMNRPPAATDKPTSSDATFMLALDPTVIPEIMHVLRSFDPAGATTH
ncbi:hypothetical protein [Devosia naphthalenivorans]|uniref:hypothetical protein n=1 Tax=Devosia naphthalenivorans TaxID=2082392 RepID=UPI000D3DACE3|nr:hypothetical protein [Devosia naphthalenivorans]